MTHLPPGRFASSPLLVLAAAISAGILLGHYCTAQRRSSFVAIAIGLGLTLSTIVLVIQNRFSLATILLTGAFLSSGFVLSSIEGRPVTPNRISRIYEQRLISPNDPVEITGVLVGEPEPAPEGFYFRIKAERIRVKGTEHEALGTVLLLAHIYGDAVKQEYQRLQLRHGARMRVMTALAREDDFRNPGSRPFTEYLTREGYEATGTIKSPLLVERLDDESVFLPLAWVYQWRALLQNEFSQRFSAETAGVLNAALFGNPHNISAGAAERFRAGGTFHILVISGMQIAFIAGIVVLIVRRLSRRQWTQFLLATTFLWAYTIAVGAQISVVRAALMFTVTMFAPLVARRSTSLNAIAGAGLVLLVWNASDLFDPSFQLTFLSVLSIVSLAVPLLRDMQRIGSWQPTMVTPVPPHCPAWFRKLSEALFWSERAWKAEIGASNISYRLFKTPVAAKLERWGIQRALRFATAAVIVSASVQIGLLPLMVVYFHRVSIASLILNIFVGFLMAIMAIAALAAILVAQLTGWLAAPLVVLAEKTNWLMIHAVDPFSLMNLASIRLPHYSGWKTGVYILYFALLVLLIAAFRRWDPFRHSKLDAKPWRNLGSVTPPLFVVVLLVVIFHPFSAAKPDEQLHVDFLDVGQGDSALLTMPDGATLLIDGGGYPNIDWNPGSAEREQSFQRDARSIGERVVSEYLWSRGLDQIDYVLATHADADHLDGLNDVVRNFKVQCAIVARTPPDDAGFEKFAVSLREAGVPIVIIGSGDSMQLGKVMIDVLWPPQLTDVNSTYRNNDALVLRVRYGERTLLFAADIEKESENALLKSGVDLRSDVVKVAHHGSRTSSTPPFVETTRAALAVISVGRTSMFGHPHKEVVDRWRANGAQVMTTGEKGMISVVTNSRDLKVSTFVP